MLSLNLIEMSQTGASLQTLPRVGKSAHPGANCPPLAYLLLSNNFKKQGWAARQPGLKLLLTYKHWLVETAFYFIELFKMY